MARNFRTKGQIAKYLRSTEAKYDSTRGTENQIIFQQDGKHTGSPNLTFDGSVFEIVGDLSASNFSTSGQINTSGDMNVGNLYASGDISLLDDELLTFGDDNDAFIKYNSGTDFMVISGSSQGIVLSGSTIQVRGVLQGASPLKLGGEIQIVPDQTIQGDVDEPDEDLGIGSINFGANTKLFFGDNKDAFIRFRDGRTEDYLEISGSSAGVIISGSHVYIDKNLGIGVHGDDITHAITLPDNSDNTGKVKANAYLTYSSIRYKKDVEPLKAPLETLKKLDGVSYVWKDTGKLDYGFIAEEVGKVLPEIVEFAQDGEHVNSMDYIRIISFLVEGVKAQDKKIEELSNKLHLLVEKLDKPKV